MEEISIKTNKGTLTCVLLEEMDFLELMDVADSYSDTMFKSVVDIMPNGTSRGTCYLESIHVDKQYRSMGHGRELIALMLKNKKIKNVFLTLPVKNTDRAMNFYTSLVSEGIFKKFKISSNKESMLLVV